MELTKEMAKGLKEPFMPNGNWVEIRELTFRKTNPNEVFRCCVQTGFDPQSGPFFCGEIAELVADVIKDNVMIGKVALCNHRGHKPPPGVKITE